MNRIEIFLEKLQRIENELECLSREYSDIYKEYSGLEFAEQSILAEDKLDNLILATTHEVATEIGFCRQNINYLVKYILFRKAFKSFTENELEAIIDNQELNSKEKLYLQKRINGNITEELSNIKKSWNKSFENKSFHKIKQEIKL